MDSRVDTHWHFVRVVARDALVHIEEVAVLSRHSCATHAGDGFGEVQVDAACHAVDLRPHTATLVAHVLCLTACDIAGNKVTEGGVDTLQVVVAIFLGNVTRILLAILCLLRNPNTTVVTQGFGHQGQLGLLVSVLRNTGRVNLGEAGVREVCALAVCTPNCGGVAAHGVRRQEEDVSVAAGCQNNRIRNVGFKLAGGHIARDDTASAAVRNDEFDHFVAGVLGNGTGSNLTLERLVGANQQLLTCLATCVESTRHLDATEGAVVEQAAVFTCEGHALRDALVDDICANLSQTVDVGLTCAIVATLNGVVEEAVDGVVVVTVVLRSVDTTLRCNGVRATSGILVEEHVDVVAHLAQRGGSCTTGKAGTHDDDVKLTAVCGVDQSRSELTLFPSVCEGNIQRGLGVGDIVAFAVQPVNQSISHVSISLSGDVTGNNRQRGKREHQEDQCTDQAGENFHELAGSTADPTQRLECRPETVRNVECCQTNEDQVDNNHQGVLEGRDHSLIRSGVCDESGTDGSRGEVQDVEDDEEEEQNAGHTHGACCISISCAALDDVRTATCAA